MWELPHLLSWYYVGIRTHGFHISTVLKAFTPWKLKIWMKNYVNYISIGTNLLLYFLLNLCNRQIFLRVFGGGIHFTFNQSMDHKSRNLHDFNLPSKPPTTISKPLYHIVQFCPFSHLVTLFQNF